MNTQLTFHQPTLASRARVRACRFLVSKGAEVDALGGELMASPLQWAVRHAHLQTVRVLLQLGADPTIKDVQGFNALHLAVQFGADAESPAACAAYVLPRLAYLPNISECSFCRNTKTTLVAR